MKKWGFSLLFLVSGLFAQEGDIQRTEEIWQIDEGHELLFPDWLQAQRDIFLQRAIFDFAQVFYRIRGLDARYTEQRFNGFPMNTLYSGRPEWQQWAGLNDVTRNERYSLGIQLFEEGIGDIQGGRAISLSPSDISVGTRVTLSETNRSYRHRLMCTYKGDLNSKWSYALSFSKRWAQDGIVDGSPYNAYAGYLGLEWVPGNRSSLILAGIWNFNRRTRLPAMTEEVFRLKGVQYSPLWGTWGNKRRIVNHREFTSPLGMAQYKWRSKGFRLHTGFLFQDSKSSQDRLGYFNAPNPNPTYYRYLPSYYLNSPLGADYLGAEAARQAFVNGGQLNWEYLLRSNTNPLKSGEASYVLYGDHRDTRRITAYMHAEIVPKAWGTLRLGAYWIDEVNLFYAKLDDLLGAAHHDDIDPFSDTKNDLDGNSLKDEGDVFKYHYELRAHETSFYAQWQIRKKYWQLFLAGNWGQTQMQRTGLFRNGRFPDHSGGKGELTRFDHYGGKAGLQWRPSGRHRLGLNGFYRFKPPGARQVYINPRDNQKVIPQITNEKNIGWEINYQFRFPQLTGRLSAYTNRIEDGTNVNFFYVDSGIGSDFVQEVATAIAQEYRGIELGVKYQVTSDVEINLAGSIGSYTYAGDPEIRINFDPAELPEGSGQLNTELDLGLANISGYHIGQGPETAVALGLTYNAPAYWWAGISMNYLADRYIRPALITRTQSFFMDPETGMPFANATEERVKSLLEQRTLRPVYLLNLIGGKSWKIDQMYLGLFLSCSNVFDALFPTGGFEQSRNGNFGQMYQDQLGGSPTFGPRLWYNRGRTYFVNVSLRL